MLALDTYETFNLLDTWLRQTFVPALPDNVLTILAGRQGPNPAWLTIPGWEDLVQDLELRDLTDDETRTLLRARGFTDSHIQRLSRFARGHPLAIELAVAALRTQPDLEIDQGPPPKVLQRLTQAFLTGLSSEVMQVVEAAATVRRVTEPLLRALLDRADVREFFAQLQDLPFIDTTNDGLLLHDVVRETVAKDLARRIPNAIGLIAPRPGDSSRVKRMWPTPGASGSARPTCSISSTIPPCAKGSSLRAQARIG